MNVLYIDIGGSGIKGAPVDVETGKLLVGRIPIKTPKRAEPESIAAVVAEIARSFEWQGLIGGRISKKSAKFIPLLEIETSVAPAQFLNETGIVGAALAVEKMDNGA